MRGDRRGRLAHVDNKALGLDIDLPEDLAQPLEIAMVLKGFDSDGHIAYWVTSTPGLTGVEIIGMMRWGEAVALTAE